MMTRATKKKFYIGFILILLISIFIILKYILNGIVFGPYEGPYKVSGRSMLPTFNDGFLWTGQSCETEECRHSLKRGETVVLDMQLNEIDESYIKRVVGLPLEKVIIRGGDIYINDHQLIEKYVEGQSYPINGQRCIRFNLGNDEFFVLGDNRGHSKDSRLFGIVKVSQVLAHASFEKYNNINSNPDLSSEKTTILDKDCPVFEKQL